MDHKWNGWEVWRFTKLDEEGTFLITSWTHDNKVLCSNGEGGVFTTENKGGSWERWNISLHPNGHGVRIRSVEHGRYLAYSGQDIYTMDKEEDTAWNLVPAHGNRFFISATCHDKRLSSSIGHPFTSGNRKAWEVWVVEPVNNQIGHFTIRSQEHGKYLASLNDGRIIVRESQQHWTIHASPHGGFFIQSVDDCRKLSCNDNGDPFTADTSSDGGWETWHLEAVLPHTISGKQIWSWVGIGVTTITLAVSMPFAVMGIVGAMGFGSGGIAAGSMAAGMMSAEAIASGGAVAAGGTVASLQSIGAVGLGVAGASAAATTGAVVGGLVSSGAAAASGGLSNHQRRISLEKAGVYLPLCSWQMWVRILGDY